MSASITARQSCWTTREAAISSGAMKVKRRCFSSSKPGGSNGAHRVDGVDTLQKLKTQALCFVQQPPRCRLQDVPNGTINRPLRPFNLSRDTADINPEPIICSLGRSCLVSPISLCGACPTNGPR